MLFMIEIWVLAASVGALILLARMGDRGILEKLLRNELAASSLVSVIVTGVIYGVIGTWFEFSPIIGSSTVEGVSLAALVVILLAVTVLAGYRNPAAGTAG